MKRVGTIQKNIGETPLEAIERFRSVHAIEARIPLAYAGRLDPMASGKLLVLIGDECKRQKEYHTLDKKYTFEVLFGVASDSGDVLGIVTGCDVSSLTEPSLMKVAHSLVGDFTFPYPRFSSKTVKGKPLHTWTVEGRLHEIDIPHAHSKIHSLTLKNVRSIERDALIRLVSEKIETIPPVTDTRKALGNDFRRGDVRRSWMEFEQETRHGQFIIATFECVASSGTYMRSLAEEIARRSGTCGLALSIHRTCIGRFITLWKGFGVWFRRY